MLNVILFLYQKFLLIYYIVLYTIYSAAYLLFGVLTPMAIGQEEAKNSKYISRMEGRFGKLEHGHH